MISAKERAKLRSISNDFANLVYIGKDGVTENVIKQINDNLLAHELIKIKVQNNFDFESKTLENNEKLSKDKKMMQLSQLIAEKSESEIVSVCGGIIVLYKLTSKKGFKHYLV